MTAVPRDLLDRLAALERAVRTLRGRSQIRPALDSVLGGDVVIGEGGQLMAQTPAGARTFLVGQTPQGDWGVGLGREDGTAALTIGDDVATDGQMVRMWSRGGQVIAMDDAYAPGYLGRPCLPIPMSPTSGANTSNTSLTIAYTGSARVQNAVLYAAFETYTPAGVTADVRFEDSDGVIESWVANVSGGWEMHEITVPARQPHMTHVNYRLLHSVRSGTGPIATNCLGVYGRHCFTADEAP